MSRIRLTGAALIMCAVLLRPASSAQIAPPQAPAHAAPAKPKLAPRQRFALSILDQQSGAALGLSPAARSFALLEIARGYQNFERPKALAALRHAFQATQAIEQADGQGPSLKQALQRQVVEQLISLDPAYCEQLVPQLAGSAKSRAIEELVSYYAGKKQFARAVSLLGELGDQEVPYLTVATLMQALPPAMAADKLNLFSQALASYSQRQARPGLDIDDFGVFISRTWQGLPHDLVLQAVDELLTQARQSDQKIDITVGAEKGAASFSSTYEYNLFQVMPVLNALDPGRAEQLLQDDRELQATLRQFPNGLQSLAPGNGAPDSISMRSANVGESSASDRYADELRRQTGHIISQAEKNPKQALASAMSLPDFRNTRALALLRLAETILKSSPGYAADSLHELLKIVPSIQDETMQAGLLSGAGDDYLKLADADSAKKVVEQGFELAQKLYSTDTDASDPNQAVKAEWPSTSVWHQFVTLAAKISPQTALQAINTIPDPEIQSLETIALANSLLGASPGPMMVAVKTKSKSRFMMSAPAPPSPPQ